MSRIFINYRRLDTEGYVGRLYDHLLKKFKPDDIFMDVQNIRPGVDFVQALEDAVAGCDVFIAMIGPHWLRLSDEAGMRRLDAPNDFVRLEIASALKQDKLIFPVLVGGVTMPAFNDLPDEIQGLARRNALSLDHKEFARDVEALIELIRAAVPSHASFKKMADSAAIQQKTELLKAVRIDLVGATDSPLYTYRNENRYFPVLGEGNPDANILFIGEAPGSAEAETGKVFVGPSGGILDEMLASVDLSREDVFLTNILLDRAPGNRNPTPEELAYYTPFTDRIIEIIQPRVIVTLGRFAMEYLLKKLDVPEKRGKISKQHGKLIKAQMPYGDIHVVPMYHPAFVLYTPNKRDVLRQDFDKLRLFV